MRRVLLIVTVGLASVALLAPAVGHADDGVAASAASSFVPPVVVLQQGSGLLFAHTDAVAAAIGDGHNLTHNVAPASRRFASATIFFGATAPVVGVAALPPGAYPFVCTVHGILMTGRLQIV